MYKKIIYMLAIWILPGSLYAQSKWNGGGNDGRWSNPLNWASGIAPLTMPTEDITLDNSLYPDSYIIRIGATDSLVIHSVLIAPAAGKSITLMIDSSSKVGTAFTVTSNEQGITILNGGVFVNASGAADGAVISITDSMRIRNGGIYSHRTRRAHAALVSRLSREAGTEYGVFEFNIPSASNTLSLSNQVYGTLRLSGEEYGKNCTYSGGAASPLYIRGNLELGSGVTFSLNFSDTIFIRGNYLQQGGSFNIANSTRSSRIAFYGDLIQSAGMITKTGSAMPSLLFNGSGPQNIKMADGIQGNISLKVDNPSEIRLLSPVIIPGVMELIKGRVISSAATPLIVGAAGRVIADSTRDLAFVDGPLRKEGLLASDNFLFPVGKNSLHRWLCLRNATGNFTVEYLRTDPHLFSTVMDTGIDHISSLECWSVKADTLPAATGNVVLSYDENSSGGVTDLATLRVVTLPDNTSWHNVGNEGITGSAGGAGSVQSGLFAFSGTGSRFTLGSSRAVQNPLPLRLISFTASRIKDHVLLTWKTGGDDPADHFEVQSSLNGLVFTALSKIAAERGISDYVYNDLQPVAPVQFYRLKITDMPGSAFYSRIIKIAAIPSLFQCYAVKVLPGNVLEATLQSEKERSCRFELFDMSARKLMSVQKELTAGNNTIRFPGVCLPEGVYILHIADREHHTIVRRFLK